ncbi:hypothetical protein [Nocardia sp. alder85J]|uniref:hypothetical protein n=1 Tax=Nocardia sp. alder85J TaxID=2862949 RepID=UPI001CD792EE|nr:hypothetical protein [Nocardia sp. alder85J]MCX4094384.1 hypothetical protein [Nocardia sp. alder85J]
MKPGVSLAIAVTTITLAAGLAAADPAPLQQLLDEGQPVTIDGRGYVVERDDDSVVLTAAEGAFDATADSLLVRDGGTVVDSLPLRYRRDDRSFPIGVRIDGHTVRLTPATDAGVAVEHPLTAGNVARARTVESFTPRDQQELSAFSQRATIAGVVGAVVGAIVGGGLGCLAGAVVGSVTAAVTTLLTGLVPGAVIGCIAGTALIGAVGTIGGAALVAGPILLWSAFQYFTTILTPCVGPGTYCVDPAAPKAVDG